MLGSTIEKVQGMRPYTPLELAGRDIYIREGCYNCHSQMIRTLRDEVERYGHYSLAAESMYDHPFQWGSKRTGPDLARVGGKYSDAWQVDHLMAPRDVVPETIMPGYPFLAETQTRHADVAERMTALKLVGVPYTDEMITKAKADLDAQINPTAGRRASSCPAIRRPRYANSTATRHEPTEMDASSPICRCSARWSTSPSSTPPDRTCAEGGSTMTYETVAMPQPGDLAPPVRRHVPRRRAT